MSNDRVVCRQCGSNNFATQAACWKCGTALAAAVSSALTPSPVAASALPAPQAESPTALWSSLFLGILFPFIAIPVGFIFLMLDDRRKAQIGWWNLLFGTVGTILNVVVTMAMISPMLMGLIRSNPLLRGTGGGESSLQSEVAPPSFPGIPNQRP
jgi:uncharacterized membrane protein